MFAWFADMTIESSFKLPVGGGGGGGGAAAAVVHSSTENNR